MRSLGRLVAVVLEGNMSAAARLYAPCSRLYGAGDAPRPRIYSTAMMLFTLHERRVVLFSLHMHGLPDKVHRKRRLCPIVQTHRLR